LIADDVIKESSGGGGGAGGEGLPAVHANLILYVSPIIFVFGMVGNSLTIAVMLRRRYRGSSVRMFMLLLAVFDSVVLLSTMPPDWLAQATGIKVRLPVFTRRSRWLEDKTKRVHI
jgi:hypothetical protein